MKKNLKKDYKKYLKVPITAWNYKQHSILPTRKQEEDFISNLKTNEKEYKIIPIKPMPKFAPDFKMIYHSWWETLLRKILRKGFYDK